MAFAKDFVWGAASSAYQTEGSPRADGGGESIWDVFCRRPGAVADGFDGSAAPAPLQTGLTVPPPRTRTADMRRTLPARRRWASVLTASA